MRVCPPLPAHRPVPQGPFNSTLPGNLQYTLYIQRFRKDAGYIPAAYGMWGFNVNYTNYASNASATYASTVQTQGSLVWFDVSACARCRLAAGLAAACIRHAHAAQPSPAQPRWLQGRYSDYQELLWP